MILDIMCLIDNTIILAFMNSISNTCVVETGDSNDIPDSPDMCDNDIQNDQNAVECDNERVALANLIANLKLDVDENKKIQKQLKKANASLTQELKECKSTLTEFERYKAFNDRTVDYDKLERKLNETLGLLAQKDIDIKEGLKLKAYEISVVQEKHDELVKQSLLTKSHYEGLVKEKTKVITDLKLKEEKDIDKMISMENQLKFLNEIVYKRSQSSNHYMKRISDKRTKNEAKTDKTEHGMEEREKAKVKKSKVKAEADIEEMLNGPTRTYLMGRGSGDGGEWLMAWVCGLGHGVEWGGGGRGAGGRGRGRGGTAGGEGEEGEWEDGGCVEGGGMAGAGGGGGEGREEEGRREGGRGGGGVRGGRGGGGGREEEWDERIQRGGEGEGGSKGGWGSRVDRRGEPPRGGDGWGMGVGGRGGRDDSTRSKDRFWKIPIYYDDDDDEESSIPLKDIIISELPPCVAITPVLLPVLSIEEPDNSLSMGDEYLDTILATEPDEVIKSSVEDLVPIPSESEGISDKMCDVSFRDNSPPLDISKDQFEDFFDSNNDSTSINDDSFSIDNIDYVEAPPPHSELVSLEEVKDFHPEDEELEDGILREKLSKINLLIAKIEALKDNPTPSSDFMTKSPSTSPNSFLEETNISYNSLPKSETFCFNLEEKSSGNPTSYTDLSLLDYKAFFCDSEPDLEDFTMDSFMSKSPIPKNSGSTTIPADISLPDLKCFYFKSEPDLGDLTSIIDLGIRENVSSTTNVNLPFQIDQSPLFAYVVWIFLYFLTYPVALPYLLSAENEDIIFDPNISIYHSFMMGVSHQSGTFMKFNVYLNHLNESLMEILSSTGSPMDQ
ncbi:hypothetical protein Tco_0089806 [Tanacetum coccineum]